MLAALLVPGAFLLGLVDPGAGAGEGSVGEGARPARPRLLCLRNQYIVILVALAVVPVLWLGWSIKRGVAADLDEEARASAQSLLRRVSEGLRGHVDALRRDTLAMSHAPSIAGLLRCRDAGGIDPAGGSSAAQWKTRLAEVFLAYARTHRDTRQVRFLDETGREWVRVDLLVGMPYVVPPGALQDKSARYYFKSAMALPEGRCYVSPLDLNVERGEIEEPHSPMLRVATPVWIGGRPRGVVIINESPLSMLARLETAGEGKLILADCEGTYLYHPDESKRWAAQLGGDANIHHDWPTLREALPGGEVFLEDGERVLLAVDIPVCPNDASNRWVLGLEWDHATLFRAGRKLRHAVAATGIGVGTIALIVALIMAVVWRRPVERLASAANRLARGDFAVRVPDRRRDELGEMGRAFNMMAEALARSVENLEGQVRARTTALADSEERNRLIVETALDAVVSMDTAGVITGWNAQAEVIFRMTSAEALGRPVADTIIPPQYRREHRRGLAQCLKTGRGSVLNRRIEITALRSDGTEFPVELSTVPVGSKDGVAFSAFVRDITERKEAEEKLRRLTRGIESAGEAIFMTDQDGAIQYLNPAFSRLTGFSAAEAVGQNARLLRSGVHPKAFYEQMWQTILEGDVWTGEMINRRKDGTRFHAHLTIAPVLGHDGKVEGFVAIQNDITEQKETEAALIVAREDAEAATRAKSEFLANMSHEIRTPMTAILGYAEMLREGGDISLAPKLRLDAVDTINRNADYLLGIINDILDLSKIEAGKLEVEQISCEPAKLVAEVASMMRVRVDAKGLVFNVEYLGPIPETIQTDPTRLRQILINLIGNAVKFTEEGGVRLLVRLVDEGDEPLLQFDILDTGLGMSEQEVAKLFHPFTQADTSTTRRFGGTGLGLTISKRFAELLGGDISVIDTQEGVGTRFCATVATGPLEGVRMVDGQAGVVGSARQAAGSSRRGSTRAPSSDAPPATRLDCRILLAEDGPDNQRLISFILSKAGAQVTVKENGKLAMDAALAAREEGDPFDCVLMDMQMPVMGGYEATASLRREGYTGTIIALTAHAMASDRQKCIDAGCDDYATKPISRDTLIETIRKHLPAAVPAF